MLSLISCKNQFASVQEEKQKSEREKNAPGVCVYVFFSIFFFFCRTVKNGAVQHQTETINSPETHKKLRFVHGDIKITVANSVKAYE